MKFHLSTFLIMLALIGVSTGWVIDRYHWRHKLNTMDEYVRLVEAERARRDKQIFNGSQQYSGTSQLFETFKNLKRFEQSEHYLKSQLVSEFIQIHRKKADIEFALNLAADGYEAESIGKAILSRLNCESEKQFIEIGRSLSNATDDERFSVFSEPFSTEHESLECFARDCFSFNRQIRSIGFEADRK